MRWPRVRACWSARGLTVAFVTVFAAWVAFGTHVTWQRIHDPDSTVAVRLRLLHSPREGLTLRGIGSFRALAEHRTRMELVGPSDLELWRAASDAKFLLLAVRFLDVAPGTRPAINYRGTGERIELAPAWGIETWIAVPAATTSLRFSFDPGGPSVRYGIADRFLGARLVDPDQSALETTRIDRVSAPITVSGGVVRLGSGWRFDPGDELSNAPPDRLRTRRHAYLQITVDRPGVHTVHIPVEKDRDDAPDPAVWIGGTPARASYDGEHVVVTGPLEVETWLTLGWPSDGADRRGGYTVGLAAIRVD